MSLFNSAEDRADARTTAMFDAEPSTDRQCNYYAHDMSVADVEADDGDGMCQSCRAFVQECREESLAEIESPDFPSPAVQAAAAMIWPRSNFASLTEWLDYVKKWWPKLPSMTAILDKKSAK